LVGWRISFSFLRLLIKTLLLVVTVVHFSRYFLCLVGKDREMWRMRLSPTNPATLINAGNHVLKTLRCPITPLYLNLQLFYCLFLCFFIDLRLQATGLVLGLFLIFCLTK
jgi:hypothetical protein